MEEYFEVSYYFFIFKKMSLSVLTAFNIDLLLPLSIFFFLYF